MKKNTSGLILIYAIVLTVMVRFLAFIIVNKQSMIVSNLYYNFYDTKMAKNIYNKADIASKDYTANNSGAYQQIKGYVKTDTDLNNIFWNSKKINDFIAGSSFSGLSKIGTVSSGSIYLDVDNTSTLKIVEFDSGVYNAGGGLKVLNRTTINFPTGSLGYLTSNGITLSGALAKKYDFTNQNIALFLSYTQSGSTHPELDYLTYSVKVYNEFGSGIYINPFKIDTGKFTYFGTDIIPREGKYLSKEMTLIK
ncbi:MAG: hypothetical protein PHG82_04050 [Candidatus Gracilibacteria bacterium]|nr:hypothetical protein [Candidatus Gracilibacteria bacterium]